MGISWLMDGSLDLVQLLSVFLTSNSFAGKVVRWKMEVGSTGRREGIRGGGVRMREREEVKEQC